jgi:hypothetical protein
VVQLMFECPDTGQMLRASRRFMRWESGGIELISLHCPKCSNTHVLSRADAVLVIEEDRAGST